LLGGSTTLAAAIEYARIGLKPLLALVIPADGRQKAEHGRHFGEWLNHGSDQDLAALACAEVVCAELDVIRQFFPRVPEDSQAAAFVVHVDRAPTRVVVALRAFPEHEWKPTYPWPESILPPGSLDGLSDEASEELLQVAELELEEQEEVAIQRCIDRTGEALRRAIMGDPGDLRWRAERLWDRLDFEGRACARELLRGEPARPSVVFSLAPFLASAAAREGGAVEQKMTTLLAGAARAAYCQQRIPGSHWATNSGCGETVEDDPEKGRWIMVCGAGHVPRKSERFLSFFTRP
jgi:hypothetical protein